MNMLWIIILSIMISKAVKRTEIHIGGKIGPVNSLNVGDKIRGYQE